MHTPRQTALSDTTFDFCQTCCAYLQMKKVLSLSSFKNGDYCCSVVLLYIKDRWKNSSLPLFTQTEPETLFRRLLVALLQTFPLNPPPQNHQDGTDLDIPGGVAAGQGGGAGGDIGA